MLYLLVLFVIVFTFLLIYILYLLKKKIILQEKDDVTLKNMELVKKLDCSLNNLYCFSDDDCTSNCYGTSMFNCVKGICKKKQLTHSSVLPPEGCYEKNGYMYYYVGDTEIGNYEILCKSIDLGIALDADNTYENLMCKGSSGFEIDYTKKYPTITDCINVIGESNACFIPATKNKRRHVEFNNECASITNLIYDTSIKHDNLKN